VFVSSLYECLCLVGLCMLVVMMSLLVLVCCVWCSSVLWMVLGVFIDMNWWLDVVSLVLVLVYW